jgi:hypothetical protein
LLPILIARRRATGEGVMQELELTWGRTLSCWWLLVWRWTLVSVLAGGVFGFFVGIAGFILSWPPSMRTGIAAGGGMVIGAVWGLIVVRMALGKRYRGFRLALIAE